LQALNKRWSLEFDSEVLSDGRRAQVLVVVDDFSRDRPTSIADSALSCRRVARELDRIAQRRGCR
jgi:putative transposase